MRSLRAVHSHPKCSDCPGLCCRYMEVPLAFFGWAARPSTAQDFDYLYWLLLHVGPGSAVAGVAVYADRHALRIRVPCQALDAAGKCGIYEDRPSMCADYHPDFRGNGCPKDFPGGERKAPFFLTSVEDLRKYLELRKLPDVADLVLPEKREVPHAKNIHPSSESAAASGKQDPEKVPAASSEALR